MSGPVVDDELRAALRAEFSRALETVNALAEHLTATGAALARGNGSNLETYLSHELALLGKLDETFQRQHELLRRRGLTADRQGLEAALGCCADSELDALWLVLRKQLEDCRERNRSNARLAQQSNRRAQAALQILRGESVESTAYGPRGDVGKSTGSHSLGRV